MVTSAAFALQIRGYIELVILIFSLVVQAIAFVHCLPQRAQAFPAIGTMPKGGWLGVLGVCLLLTLIGRGTFFLFSLIGIAAAAIYLLDVRVGLRDLSDGKGFW